LVSSFSIMTSHSLGQHMSKKLVVPRQFDGLVM